MVRAKSLLPSAEEYHLRTSTEMNNPIFRGGPWDGAVWGEDFLVSGYDVLPNRFKMHPRLQESENGAIDFPRNETGEPLWIEAVYELSNDQKEYRFIGNESQQLQPAK